MCYKGNKGFYLRINKEITKKGVPCVCSCMGMYTRADSSPDSEYLPPWVITFNSRSIPSPNTLLS